jgi:hypothetical protein
VTNELEAEMPHAGLSVEDVAIALFKHKWKIVLCTLAGLIAAAAVFKLYPLVYESQAKLLVRYVLDRSVVDPIESAGGGKTSDNIMGSEVEILKGRFHPGIWAYYDAGAPVTIHNYCMFDTRTVNPKEWKHDRDELYDNMRGPIQNVKLLATAYVALSGAVPSLNCGPKLTCPVSK